MFVGTRTLARVAMLAWLVNAVPHFLYHLGHLKMDMTGGGGLAGAREMLRPDAEHDCLAFLDIRKLLRKAQLCSVRQNSIIAFQRGVDEVEFEVPVSPVVHHPTDQPG